MSWEIMCTSSVDLHTKISHQLNIFFLSVGIKNIPSICLLSINFSKVVVISNVFSKFIFSCCKKVIKVVFYRYWISFYHVNIPDLYHTFFWAIFLSNFIYLFPHFFHIVYVFVKNVSLIQIFTILNKVSQFVPVVFISMVVKLVFYWSLKKFLLASFLL